MTKKINQPYIAIEQLDQVTKSQRKFVNTILLSMVTSYVDMQYDHLVNE